MEDIPESGLSQDSLCVAVPGGISAGDTWGVPDVQSWEITQKFLAHLSELCRILEST